MRQPESTSPAKRSTEDRTPMALLPYQQRWCADTSPVKLCEKSRRIGLSWGEVDRAYDLSSILLSYNGLTVRLDGHQAFVIMQGLDEVLNYELLERAPGEEDDA